MHKHFSFSFEFFPAKGTKITSNTSLCNSLVNFIEMKPSFVSVTYGAGGTTQEGTYDMVKFLRREYPNLNIACHITSIGSSKDELRKIIENYLDISVNHFIALRGDIPQNYSGEIYYADEVVKLIREIEQDYSKPIEISVAAYPETHPHAPTAEFDMQHLKKKFDAGANHAITQFFFDNEIYKKFIQNMKGHDINISQIFAGVIPIHNFLNLQNFARKCEASIPYYIENLFQPSNNYDTDNLASILLYRQCNELINFGTPHLHFYTLNKLNITREVLKLLHLHNF